MAKRTRRKKETKAQKEKKTKLLSMILNKWVCFKQNDGEVDSYVFLFHRVSDDKSVSKMEQVCLCGDDLSDGIYLITDFDIDMVRDKKTNKDFIQLKPKKYDLKVGKYAEDEVVDTHDKLKQRLINAKYLTEDEFSLYCQSSKKPPGVEEILLSYGDYNQDKEA